MEGKVEKRNWKQKFFKEVPMKDANGNVIEGDQPFNQFSIIGREKSTLDRMNDRIRQVQESLRNRH